MKKDNEKKHKNYFLFIYWNPDDKRIFVPKRWGIGWTVNFANPYSILALIVIILIVSLLTRLL